MIVSVYCENNFRHLDVTGNCQVLRYTLATFSLLSPPLFYKVAILLIISLECDILQKEDKVKFKFCIYGIFVDLMKFLSSQMRI